MPDISLESTARVRIVDLVSEGRVKGLVNGLKSVVLDDTPVQNPNGTFNFPEFDIEFLEGSPGQRLARTLITPEDDRVVGAPVTFGKSVVRTVADDNATHARVILTFDSLFIQDIEEGDTDSKRVNVRISYKDGDNATHVVTTDDINGKELGAFDVQYQFELEGPAPRTITVERLTPDDPTPYEKSTFQWSRMVEIIDRVFGYDGSAVAGLGFNMRVFGGQIPRRRYHLDGLVCLVPSNYDTEAGTYSGIWDLTFKQDWTDNPAWVCYNLLVNPKYGMGLSAAMVDKASFYAAGKYCDGLVPNGEGGQERRFRFNSQLDTEEDAYTAAQAVASSFRGMICWAGNIAVLSVDMPGDVVKVVSNADVVDGKFFYQGVPVSGSYSVAEVTFIDPETGEPDLEVVEDDELIARFGYRPVKLYAMGADRRTQAHRLGVWFLDTTKYETESVSYRCGWDHADVIPGNLIAVADSGYAVVQNGGRIKSVPSLTQVVLDRPVQRDLPSTVYLTLPGGGILTRSIATQDTPGATLTLTSALPEKPLPHSMWAIENSDVKVRIVRVVAVREVGKGNFEISGVTHDPNKFARVELGRKIPPPDFVGGETLTPPQEVTTGRFYRLAGGGKVETVVWATWDKGDDRFYTFEVETLHGSTWTARPRTPAQHAEIAESAASPISAVRVRGRDVTGRPSSWTQRSVSADNSPVAVTVLELEPRGARRVSWSFESNPYIGAVAQIKVDGKVVANAPADPRFFDISVPLTGSHVLEVLIAPGVVGTYNLAPASSVAGLTLTFARIYQDDLAYVAPTLSWTEKPGTSYYEVWYRRDQGAQQGAWVLAGTPEGLTFDPPPILGDEANSKWVYSVIAVSPDGARQGLSVSNRVEFTPGYDVDPPAQPTGLLYEETVERLRRLHWTPNVEPDLAGYEIRAIIGDDLDFANGVPLHSGLVRMTPFEIRSVPAYTSFLAIIAVDRARNRSTPAYIAVTFTERPVENIVYRIDAGPAWTGTLSAGSIVSGVILGPNTTPLMWNANTATLMWRANSSLPMWAAGNYSPFDYQQTFTVPAGVLTIAATFQGPVRFDYKIGSGAFVPYSSPVRVPAGSLTVRAYGTGPTSGTEIKLNQMTIIVDVEDVLESVDNFAVQVGGTRVPKTKVFGAIIDVVIVPVEQASPVRAEVVDRNPTTGPLIKIRRIADNVDVGGTVQSALLKGYV